MAGRGCGLGKAALWGPRLRPWDKPCLAGWLGVPRVGMLGIVLLVV